MNTGQGISALDPTVGLLRKELEVNNVPPGQEAAYFQAKGRPLSPQLVFLIQANQQLQKDSQNMQARPPQGTVADDLSAALIQKANSGIAAHMPPRPPMREQGVAQLPVQNVGNERAYASGGIVAFAKGGSIEEEIADLEKAIKADDYIKQGGIGGSLGRVISSRTMPMGYAQRQQAERRLAQLKTAQPMFAGAPAAPAAPEEAPAAQVPAAPAAVPQAAPTAPVMRRTAAPAAAAAPALAALSDTDKADYFEAVGAKPAAPSPLDQLAKSYADEAAKKKEDRIKEAADKWEQSGVNKMEADRLARLESRTSAMDADKKRDLMMQLAASAFGSVGKGRTFAQSLGNIGSGFAQGAIGVEQRYKDLKTTLEDAKDKMAEAQALRRAGDFDSAAKAEAEARDKQRQFLVEREKLNEAERRHREQLQLGQGQIAATREGIQSRERIAGAQIAANKEIAADRVHALLARTQTMTPAQMANLRAKAIEKIDEDAIRSQVAKALKLSKVPKAGVEAEFDNKVKAAREAAIKDKMADILNIPQSNLRVADVMGSGTLLGDEE